MPGRADVVGAKSLILFSGESTRGNDDYEFKDAGLYKVDEDGNVSAVAVFMSEEGGKREKEGNVIPNEILKLSDRFMLLKECRIKVDDSIHSLSYSMIVNMATGKIYKYDPWTLFSIEGSRQTADSRFLIWGFEHNKILSELSIDNATATYRQLTNDEGKGFIFPLDYGYVNQLPNGVILSQKRDKEYIASNARVFDVGILYPNKGYDYLMDYEKEIVTDEMYEHYPPNLFPFILSDKAAIVSIYTSVYNYVDKVDNISLSFIEIGNTPGNIKIIPADSLSLSGMSIYEFLWNCYGYYETDKTFIFSLGDGQDFNRIIIFNKETNKLSEFNPSFSETMVIYPYTYYNGKVWDVFLDEGGRGAKALWINPDTRESGSFDLNLSGVDVNTIDRSYYNSGKIVLYGTRRSDGAYVVATLDLDTEKTNIEFTLPKQETVTLIPLN